MDVHRAFRVLGLPTDATAADVQEAYRDLAQVWHPDRFEHNDRLREKAARNLQRINEAFAVARDRAPDAPMPRRSVFDLTLDTVRDIGDIMQTAVTRGPGIRARQGPEVLGFGAVERTGRHRTVRRRRLRWPAVLIAATCAMVAFALAVAVWMW
jgi:hypothetical protein